jgi:hypothetical protein
VKELELAVEALKVILKKYNFQLLSQHILYAFHLLFPHLKSISPIQLWRLAYRSTNPFELSLKSTFLNFRVSPSGSFFKA